MAQTEVVIVSAVRTPIGSFMGSLSPLRAHDLGSVAIKEALKRAGVDGKEVSEVIIGQALTAAQGQNTARQAAILAGVPVHSSAWCVNMLCGSGLKSVTCGYSAIKSGEASIVVSGGQESMSQSPHAVFMRSGIKMCNVELIDTMVHDGLTDAFENIHMGITAENIAKLYNISREEQDEYAVESQKKTEVAQKNGYFSKEIVPVTIKSRKGDNVISEDEYPKHGCTLESLAELKPVFLKGGSVTPGNASGLNDGAAAVVLMDRATAEKRGAPILAKIIAISQEGVSPSLMGTGPIPAVQSVLQKAGWSLDDVDLFELNEAFAAQALAVVRELKVDTSKVNIHGGAIAIGHPIGASGTRVLVTLIYALERIGGRRGVASLCIGGGMGIAIAIERS
ncbi:unnamed protein product [Bemisia tabaci]|uniref:Uncharacterized protein n=1 Tax=Bemisia tabaci TaxID=7038 RepID=A0A9P0A6X4_BEMTA|nr:PREDICTED: uncharacterized protein LOC109035957 [Bemisia tabaci]CAH0385225.1 unnamed protein product [Bemisia tabaci]